MGIPTSKLRFLEFILTEESVSICHRAEQPTLLWTGEDQEKDQVVCYIRKGGPTETWTNHPHIIGL